MGSAESRMEYKEACKKLGLEVATISSMPGRRRDFATSGNVRLQAAPKVTDGSTPTWLIAKQWKPELERFSDDHFGIVVPDALLTEASSRDVLHFYRTGPSEGGFFGEEDLADGTGCVGLLVNEPISRGTTIYTQFNQPDFEHEGRPTNITFRKPFPASEIGLDLDLTALTRKEGATNVSARIQHFFSAQTANGAVQFASPLDTQQMEEMLDTWRNDDGLPLNIDESTIRHLVWQFGVLDPAREPQYIAPGRRDLITVASSVDAETEDGLAILSSTTVTACNEIIKYMFGWNNVNALQKLQLADPALLKRILSIGVEFRREGIEGEVDGTVHKRLTWKLAKKYVRTEGNMERMQHMLSMLAYADHVLAPR